MKYIIEIGDEFKDGYGNKLYKAKGFKSLVFDQNGLDKLKKYEADKTFEAGYQRGYEEGKKKFDPLYFEPGEVVKDKEGNKYAFLHNASNGECYYFVLMNYQVNNLFNRFMIGEKLAFSRSYLIDYKFVKTGEKVALVYIGNTFRYESCCCDKREV